MGSSEGMVLWLFLQSLLHIKLLDCCSVSVCKSVEASGPNSDFIPLILFILTFLFRNRVPRVKSYS